MCHPRVVTASQTGAKRGRGRPPRTAEQRADARAVLVERSLVAIRDEGADISIETLATRLGVGRSVIYDQFESKTGIADAIALHFVEQFDEGLTSRIADGEMTTPQDLARESVRFLVDLIDREPEYYRFSIRAMQATGAGVLDNGLARALRARAEQFGLLGARVGDDPSGRLLVDGIFGFLFASIESWQSTGEPERETVVTRLTDAVTRLLNP